MRSAGDGTWTTMREDATEQYQAIVGVGGRVLVGGLACSGGVCGSGIVVRSADGGATWTKHTVGSGVVGFTVAGGSLYADSGDLYVTADDFATTTMVPLGWATSYGVLADGDALFAYGGLRGAQLRRSSDGGQTWTTVYSGFSGSKSGYLNGLARGGTSLFALANGCSAPACFGALFRSTDGGTTWAQASQPEDYVAGLWAATDREVFIGGTALLRSTDGGASFTKVTLPVDKSILALWAASPNELYAVGQDGTILHGKR